MAKKQKVKQTQQIDPYSSQTMQGGEKGTSKKKNIMLTVAAFLTALLIILSILYGFFYFAFHNNIQGIADKYRKNIQGIPILNLALPKVPDPEDPKNMTNDQIKDKYLEYRKKSADLQKQIDEANNKIKELEKYKNDANTYKADSDKVKADAEAQLKQLEQDKKKLEEDTKKLGEMAISNDKSGFKEYFEKADPETAKKMYAEILTEQKAAQEITDYIQLLESMDTSAAASMLEKMGSAKVDKVADILKRLKKQTAAEILAAMSTDYSGKVNEKLAAVLEKKN